MNAREMSVADLIKKLQEIDNPESMPVKITIGPSNALKIAQIDSLKEIKEIGYSPFDLWSVNQASGYADDDLNEENKIHEIHLEARPPEG